MRPTKPLKNQAPVLLTAFLLLFALVSSASAQNGPPPAAVLIIRHAEKLTDGQKDLSEAGFKRAAEIPKLFTGPTARPDLPVPQVLIATHESAHSRRPVETITPLSKTLNLPIDDSIMDDDYAVLAKELLSGKYAGKIVLVSWRHGKIPQLAEDLGVKPPYQKWPDEQFDRVWRIDYKNGKATIQDLPQHLMQGDSK